MTKSAFAHFGLEKSILSALSDLGYERATPIQEQGIPVLLTGDDLLAQAQTGTGKTATFALPILSRLDPAVRAPQALILVPTRELAIQVAEAFQSYAKHMKGFSITPIYGGQDFGTQLRSIKRGSQVIVGTPGRLMDHMRRKTLSLDTLKTVVLDEADEMLRMGFAEDVEWILGQLTSPHQTALFSATLSPSIQKIAERYLKNAKKIQIKASTNTVEAIEQCYISVFNREQKLDVLTRLLEIEDNQAVIIFTRTKTESTELAERLQARGHSAAALNGDMSQNAREKTINRLKKGDLTILIATDVAARGIDVEHVTHVINYDIPYDVDAYVHRIGRTGRAGRSGKAILFVTPREMRLFKDIEHHINKSIKRVDPPSLKHIREKRASQLLEKIATVIREKGKALETYSEMVVNLTNEMACSPNEIAAALIYLSDTQSESKQSENDAFPKDEKRYKNRDRNDRGNDRGDRGDRGGKKPNRFRERSERSDRFERSEKTDRSEKPRDASSFQDKKYPRNEKSKRTEPFEKGDKGEKEFKPKKRFDSKFKPASDASGSVKSDKKFVVRKDKKDKDFSSPRSEGKSFKPDRSYKKDK